MELRLIVKQGRTLRTLRVHRPETILGRAKGCGVRIPSPEVSRRHCVLRLQEQTVTLEDLDSANGTFLNGQAIEGRRRVRPGDRLSVGPVTFEVEFVSASEAELPVAATAPEDEAPEALALDDADAGDKDLLPALPLDDLDLPLPTTEDECLPVIDEEEEFEARKLDASDPDRLRSLLAGLEHESSDPPAKKRRGG